MSLSRVFSANTYVAAESCFTCSMENNCDIYVEKGGESIRHCQKWQLKGTWNFLDICKMATTFLFSCIREFLQAHQRESFKSKIILWKENGQCSNRFFCSGLQSTTASHAISIFGIKKKSKIPLKAFFLTRFSLKHSSCY